jgi:hypothetical protein
MVCGDLGVFVVEQATLPATLVLLGLALCGGGVGLFSPFWRCFGC